MFRADEAQPQEEAAEGILFTFYLGLSGGNPRGLLGHMAESCNQAHVGLCLFRLWHAVPPRELDLAVRRADRQTNCIHRLRDQTCLAVHQFLQAVEAVRIEAVHRHADRQAVLGTTGIFLGCLRVLGGGHGYGLLCRYLGLDFEGLQQAFLSQRQERLQVSIFRNRDRAVLLDEVGSDLVGASGHFGVTGSPANDLGQSLGDSLSVFGCEFDVRHGNVPPFWRLCSRRPVPFG